MARTGLRIVIFDSELDSWWVPAGKVGQFATRKAQVAGRHSKRVVGKRTGHLAGLIEARPSVSTGKRRARSSVRSRADYSLYVERGTLAQYGRRRLTNPAMPGPGSRGKYRSPRPNWYVGMRVQGVAGQQAQNYMKRGLKKAMGSSAGGVSVRIASRYGR